MNPDDEDERQPKNDAEQNKIKEDAKEQARTSRKLLATAHSIPDYLLEMFSIPEGVSVAHTCHVDTTLPLFQIRLATGTHEGKQLGIPFFLYSCPAANK